MTDDEALDGLTRWRPDPSLSEEDAKDPHTWQQSIDGGKTWGPLTKAPPPDGAVKVPEYRDFSSTAPGSLIRNAQEVVAMVDRLEQMVLERDALVLERDSEIDKLLIEAVVLREKQARHDAETDELQKQLAWTRLEIQRLTQLTRRWWKS